MKQYIIYCTHEQTKKALELGAPIEESIDYNTDGHLVTTGYMLNGDVNDKNLDGFGWANTLLIPTAEQMIGFLEDKYNLQFLTGSDADGILFFQVFDVATEDRISGVFGKSSRKEATLAAIDAALEYLTNNNKLYGTQ